MVAYITTIDTFHQDMNRLAPSFINNHPAHLCANISEQLQLHQLATGSRPHGGKLSDFHEMFTARSRHHILDSSWAQLVASKPFAWRVLSRKVLFRVWLVVLAGRDAVVSCFESCWGWGPWSSQLTALIITIIYTGNLSETFSFSRETCFVQTYNAKPVSYRQTVWSRFKY